MRPRAHASLSVWSRLAVSLLLALVVLASGAPVRAQGIQAVDLGIDVERMDVTALGRFVEARGDTLQVETAVAADGSTGRMAVRAATPGTSPNWFVFALKNPTDRALERWIVADRYTYAGSGVVWPVLDARRMEAVTPSLGVVPDRLPFDNADAFRLSIEPGQTVTFVVELAGDRAVRLNLWRGTDYEKRIRNRQLFQGVLLGIVGLMALFLTTVFAANHKAIFPSAALFTWCVLAYLLVDFGFWSKLFTIKPEENAQYRAATEAAMSASLLIFAHTFLRLGRWHALIRTLIGLAMIGALALVGLAFIDPRLAATFARLGFVVVLSFAALVTIYLAIRGQDRALAIIPTWVLFGVWVFAVVLVLTGRINNDVMINAMIAGLVAIVMLLGFTVTQFAFRSTEPSIGGSGDEQKLRALAVDSTGAAVFEWNGQRGDVRLGPVVLAALGQKPAEIREPLTRFLQRLHMADRDRLAQALNGMKDQSRGLIQLMFRMKHVDGTDRWFELEGSGVASGERRMARCIGLVRDVSDARRVHDKLLQDAVHDGLTQLPNRTLFQDRLDVALARARTEPLVRPTVFFIDLDRFQTLNATHGASAGDFLLVSVAKRLARLIETPNTVARWSGDQFAVLLINARSESEISSLAETIRDAVKAAVSISGQDIVLTCSIGVAGYDSRAANEDLISSAEAAMYRARRDGRDRIAVFSPSMRAEKDDRQTIEADLLGAIERRQINVQFQPIMVLRTEELAGFEAQVRWDHPRFGVLDPAAFVPADENSALMTKLGVFVLQTAIAEAQRWNKEFERPGAPLFVSVNISTRQLFGADLVNAVRQLLAQARLPKDALRLEITESVVMENPEHASAVLTSLAAAGAKLSLDDFGAGYSSLSYLTRFPFDTLKIDQGLVYAATQGNADTAVLRSIVALCHELGKTVVAEGTETEDDAALMRLVGCDFAQGVYYGDPKGEKETFALVRDLKRADKRRRGSGLFRLRTRRIEDAPQSVPPTATPTTPPQDKAATQKRRTSIRRGEQPQQAQPPQVAVATAVPPHAAPSPQSARLPAKVPPVPPPVIAPLPMDQSLSRLRAEIAQATVSSPRTMPPPVSAVATSTDIAPPLPPVAPPVSVGGSAPAPFSSTAKPAGSKGPPPLPKSQTAAPAHDGASTTETSIASPTLQSPPPAPRPMPAPAPATAAPTPVERRPAIVAAQPKLDSLPPAIAASLAKLAGIKTSPAAPQTETSTKEPAEADAGGGTRGA